MVILKLVGDVTPNQMLEAKYERAKLICSTIWDKPDKFYFEDIFHDTIYKCLVTLGQDKLSLDYMINYFFKAFRINMIRHYGYSYNRLKSGIEIEEALLRFENSYDSHLDGFGMLDRVKTIHGEEIHNMLWDNLCGIPYKDLDLKYKINSFYYLNKVKNELKKYYLKCKYERPL